MGGGGVLRAAGSGVCTVKDAVGSAGPRVLGLGLGSAKAKRVGCGASTTLVATERGIDCVGGEELVDVNGFATPPGKDEVHDAISTIQRIVVPITFSQYKKGESQYYVDVNMHKEEVALQRNSSTEIFADSKSDWIEPEIFYSLTSPYHDKPNKVYEALQMLQINPAIQSMVVSLSTDKDVWDAVMKNEAVEELKKSLCEDADDGSASSEKKDETTPGIFEWLFEKTKSKITEFVEKIMKLMKPTCHTEAKDKKNERNDIFDNIVTSSFMLTVMVFIIVVATRIRRAG